jgi:hypothetical protein
VRVLTKRYKRVIFKADTDHACTGGAGGQEGRHHDTFNFGEGVEHLRRRAFEEAATSEREQRVPHEDGLCARAPVDDVPASVPGSVVYRQRVSPQL